MKWEQFNQKINKMIIIYLNLEMNLIMKNI